MVLIYSIPFVSFSQFDMDKCLNDIEQSEFIPQNPSGTYESKYGFFLPVKGTIRVLVVFAQIDSFRFENRTNNIKYNCSKLNSGIYFYKITSSGKVKTGKFVVTN